MPNDIANAINECQILIEEIDSKIKHATEYHMDFTFDILVAIDRVFFYTLDDWSNRVEIQIVNFKKLGYKDVYDSTKLHGIICACFRKIHDKCFRGNENIEHYTVSNLGTIKGTRTFSTYEIFRLSESMKKVSEPELKKL